MCNAPDYVLRLLAYYIKTENMVKDKRTRKYEKFGNDTVWLSLDQMAELFQRDKSTISRHIKKIFEERELDACQTFGR